MLQEVSQGSIFPREDGTIIGEHFGPKKALRRQLKHKGMSAKV
jgi:hypothetical protein